MLYRFTQLHKAIHKLRKIQNRKTRVYHNLSARPPAKINSPIDKIDNRTGRVPERLEKKRKKPLSLDMRARIK